MTEKARKESLMLKLLPGMRALEYAIAEHYGFEYFTDSAKISWKELCGLINAVKEDPDTYYHERDPYLSDEARSFFDSYVKSDNSQEN